MSGMDLQRVRLALDSLEQDPMYLWHKDQPSEARFSRFRQGVELTGERCQEPNPNADALRDIRDYLACLYVLCIGSLKPFEPFIKRAQAALA